MGVQETRRTAGGCGQIGHGLSGWSCCIPTEVLALPEQMSLQSRMQVDVRALSPSLPPSLPPNYIAK